MGSVLTLAVLAAPSPSFGSTAALRITPPPGPGFPPTAAFEYHAAPGEANDLVIDVSFKQGLLTIKANDQGASVSPGERCTAADAHSVTCSYQAPGVGNLFYVPTSTNIELGDRDDSTLIDPPAVGGTPGVEDLFNIDHLIDGGAGNDRLTIAKWAFSAVNPATLRGGPGNDVLRNATSLDGGGGRDELHGLPDSILTDGDTEGAVDSDVLDGGGNGRVDYGSRTRPLRIDLQNPAPDGEPGEGDVITGVSELQGGRGNDFLAGTPRNNMLQGGRGNDHIYGRGGNDLILVNQSDRADGGPGNDHFSEEAGRRDFTPTLICGPGNDTAAGATKGPGPWLSRTCENVDDDQAEDSVLRMSPPRPVRASSRGRLVFRFITIDGQWRLTLTRGRAPLRRLTSRHFKVTRTFSVRRVALNLPPRVARRAQHRPVRLRARIDLNSRDAGHRDLLWRFDLRLPRR